MSSYIEDSPASRKEPKADRSSIERQIELKRDVSPQNLRVTFAIVFVAVLVLAVIPISVLTPPFQSPDEFAHINRAYVLSKGHIFVQTEGTLIGGEVDTGLQEYMGFFQIFPFQYPAKVTRDLLRQAKQVQWSEQRTFVSFPNTAVYLPLSYIPQAIGLGVGERLGLSVDTSYHLARATALLTIAGMLLLAMLLYPVPIPVMALFCTPMVLFQLGAASLDGMNFATCVVAGSLCMRAADARFRFSHVMHFGLIFCLLLLATSRINLLPLTLLPAALYWIRRSRLYLLSTAALVTVSLAWILHAVLAMEAGNEDAGPLEILIYHLNHPAEFLRVVVSSIASPAMILGYWRMFIGVLAWLDTPVSPSAYITITILLAATAIVGGKFVSRAQMLERFRLAMTIGTLLSAVLLFVLFLLTYTVHPSDLVAGVQGRYFYPIAIFMGFAVFGPGATPTRIYASGLIVFMLLGASVMSAVPSLIGRFWLTGP